MTQKIGITGFALLATLASLLAGVAAEPTTVIIKGLVEDQMGGVISGAKVRLVNSATGVRVDAASDETGHFELPAQSNAGYVLSVRAKGFESGVREFAPGRLPTGLVRFLLDVAENTDSVQVTADAVMPTANETLTSVAIDEHFLRDLPLKNGDPMEAASLFTDSAVMGGGTGAAQILVDGVESDSLDIPVSSIKQLEVNRSPYSAEFGRPGRGRIEVTTKRGSHHRYHGNLSTLLTNTAVNARNAFSTINPPHQRNISEGEVDGPISSKIIFTLSSHYEINNDNIPIDAVTPSGPFSANVKFPDRFTYLAGRVDYRTSYSNKLAFTYNYKNKNRRNQQLTAFDLPGRGTNYFDHLNEFKVLDATTLSSGMINQFAFTFRRDRQDRSSTLDAPAILVPGSFNAGSTGTERHPRDTATHVEDSIRFTRGKHTLGFGGGVRLRFLQLVETSNFNGTYSFASLNDYVNGNPYLYTRNIGNPKVDFTVHDSYGFVQDEIRLSKSFSLYAGTRYEWQSDVNFRKNFAPRFSVAKTLGTQTVLRGGAGIFYERPPVNLEQKVNLFDGSHVQQVILSNPSFPVTPSELVSGLAVPSVERLARDFRLPSLFQASMAVERRLGEGRNYLTAEYVTVRGTHLFRTRNINAPLPGSSTPLDPNFVTINQYESSGFSRNNSFFLTFKSFSRKKFDLIVQYILSKSMDDTSGLFFWPANSWNTRADWGPSDADRRHRLNVVGNYKLGWGFRLGAIVKQWSGVPFNITTGYDNNFDTIANDRPPGVGRNSGRAPGFRATDLRLARDFRFGGDKQYEARFGLDAFNVLNQVSYKNIVGTQTSDLYLLPNSAYPARSLQFSFRFKF